MKTLEFLLDKFKRGTATDTEKQLLLEALSVNEQQLMQLLEKDFGSNVQHQIRVITPERSEQLFRQIQHKLSLSDETIYRKKGKVFQLTVKTLQWLSAACIIGIMYVGGLYVMDRSKNKTEAVAVNVKNRHLKTVSNSSEKPTTTALEDGSMITLEPNSAISYYQPFMSQKRDVSLTGKARFKVAKDKLRPFTVFANGIATTALGTEFFVDAREGIVKVKLFEGKVVVRVANRDIRMRDIYLKPGEQLSVNKQTSTYAVNNFKLNNNSHRTGIEVNRKTKNDVALTFNKTPLTEVFSKISKKYSIEVKYNTGDLKSLSFTGSFLTHDSLPTILSIICTLNDLNFKHQNGVVLISK